MSGQRSDKEQLVINNNRSSDQEKEVSELVPIAPVAGLSNSRRATLRVCGRGA